MKNPRKVIAAKLDAATGRALREIALARDITVQQVMAEAIAAYLPSYGHDPSRELLEVARKSA